jgi:hypothetical protein
MNTMNILTAMESNKFKHYLGVISDLYKVDDDFRTMCDDYCQNRLNIDKLKRKCLETRVRQLECQELSMDLAEEILEYVINRQTQENYE